MQTFFLRRRRHREVPHSTRGSFLLSSNPISILSRNLNSSQDLPNLEAHDKSPNPPQHIHIHTKHPQIAIPTSNFNVANPTNPTVILFHMLALRR
ncbi:hypothetical protein U1Q18_050326 [Sarracenia purpurea var. burkii]